jgi:hypothetical protein
MLQTILTSNDLMLLGCALVALALPVLDGRR